MIVQTEHTKVECPVRTVQIKHTDLMSVQIEHSWIGGSLLDICLLWTVSLFGSLMLQFGFGLGFGRIIQPNRLVGTLFGKVWVWFSLVDLGFGFGSVQQI